MTTETYTFDLTIPIAMWTTFWCVLALIFQSWTLAIIAIAPLAMWGAACALMGVLASIVLFVFWFKGEPITLTTPRKGSRTVQRKKKSD